MDPGRELFLSKAVPDVKLRAYAEAMLLYHAADLLPLDQQAVYMEEATKLLPEPLRVAAGDAGKAILKVRPQSTLEALRPVIETEAFAPAETFMLSMKLSTFAASSSPSRSCFISFWNSSCQDSIPANAGC